MSKKTVKQGDFSQGGYRCTFYKWKDHPLDNFYYTDHLQFNNSICNWCDIS